MKKLLPLIFLAACSQQSINEQAKKTVHLKNADFHKINKQLDLQLTREPMKNASGYYSVREKELDGLFEVIEDNVGHNKHYDSYYQFKNKIQGSYSKGKKSGSWRYSFVHDDGKEQFERHEITIKYNQNGQCFESHFDGIIDPKMPAVSHTFRSPALCAPTEIRNKALELWEKNGAIKQTRK
ncbi:MAG: hypothetical protein ACRC9T_09505 [Vibrionaceae bacterium]